VLPPNSFVYLYRDLPDEVEVPFDQRSVRDNDIVVVDSRTSCHHAPGGHVVQTPWSAAPRLGTRGN
jgi:tRNA pseudouridine32 synthase/23S rRNA pseudouridine746 synthase